MVPVYCMGCVIPDSKFWDFEMSGVQATVSFWAWRAYCISGDTDSDSDDADVAIISKDNFLDLFMSIAEKSSSDNEEDDEESELELEVKALCHDMV